jgi:hypothetical protein
MIVNYNCRVLSAAMVLRTIDDLHLLHNKVRVWEDHLKRGELARYLKSKYRGSQLVRITEEDLSALYFFEDENEWRPAVMHLAGVGDHVPHDIARKRDYIKKRLPLFNIMILRQEAV